jgi:hypothetical protein
MISRSNRVAALSLVALIIGLLISGTSAAPDEPTTRPADTAAVTVWYDVSELIKPAEDPPVKVEDVQKLITDFVDPNSWKDHGGDVGWIITYGHMLIITHTPDDQNQIKALLEKLGRLDSRGATVTVDAYWLRLTPAQLPAGQTTVAPQLLTDADVLYARARAVGFEGQAVTVNVTRTVEVVTHATPVVAPGASAYDLTTTPQEYGVKLSETPTHVDGDHPMLMSVDSTITMQQDKPADAPTTRPAAEVAADATRGVFNSSATQIHTKTAVRLKPGVPTVIAGMTDRPGSSDGRTLCLVLCATVEAAKP